MGLRRFVRGVEHTNRLSWDMVMEDIPEISIGAGMMA